MCVTPEQLALLVNEVANEVLGTSPRDLRQVQFLADFSARIMTRVKTSRGCSISQRIPNDL